MKLTADLLLAGLMVMAWNGCAKKGDPVRLQTTELEKVFPGLAAAAAAQAEPTTQDSPTDAKQCVIGAISAARRNDFATGVILLRKAVRLPGLSPEQHMAVQEAKKAWVIDLTNRAAKGDESAKAALAAIDNAI